MAFRMNNWSDALDDQLIEKYRIKLSLINAGREDLAAWLKISLLSKLLSLIPPSFLPVKLLAYASNKRSWQLRKRLAAEGKWYDHIQAHNLGALYPAYYWAKKSGSTFSFDVEDFHPEEVISYQANWERIRRYKLMKTILPHCTSITAASPLIARETKLLLPGDKQIMVIHNSFFEEEFVEPNRVDSEEPLKLVWFSQKISRGRGLDLILDVHKNLKSEVSITLIGSLDSAFYQDFLKETAIEIIEPLPQEKLHKLLSNFDVGLLLERQSADYNRNICLTNKQFAYLQSGLYVIATNTLAHTTFFKDHPNLASIIDQTSESMEKELKGLIERKKSLRKESKARFEYGKRFSFDKEISKLKLGDL